jgi:hypothetical protein
MGACRSLRFFPLNSAAISVETDDRKFAWQAALEAGGRVSKLQALALASTDLDKLLGGGDVTLASGASDLVATQGGDLLSFESKVVGVISPRRKSVDLF